MPEFERAYDAMGIREDDFPPPGVRALAVAATYLVASDMTRAIESAQRLVPSREIEIQPLLREMSIAPPLWIPGTWPITLWGLLSFVEWSARLTTYADHALLRRADSAAGWLIERSRQGNVVAVTHGGFRRLLTHRLVQRGWHCVDRSQGYRNWSAWTLESANR